MGYKNSEGYSDPTAGAAMSNIIREYKKEQREKYARLKEIRHRPKVYIVSPFAGDTATNIKKARKYCRFAAGKKKNPIASHLLYPQFLNDADEAERELGLQFGLALMSMCAEVWCFGKEKSAGMQQELERARRHNMKIRYFTEDLEELV